MANRTITTPPNPPTMLPMLKGYQVITPRKPGPRGNSAPYLAFWGVFPTQAAAEEWIRESRSRREFNYYVGWREVGRLWGIQGNWVTWVGEGQVHLNLWDNNPHNVPAQGDAQ